MNETSRSAPPPCRQTARLAEKSPLRILICARHQKILLKGKGDFSDRLCPQPFGQGGGRSLSAPSFALVRGFRLGRGGIPPSAAPSLGRRKIFEANHFSLELTLPLMRGWDNEAKEQDNGDGPADRKAHATD
jgi:hypothetical protein